MQNLQTLSGNLPEPMDDGECRHLIGISLPELELSSTQGGVVNLADISGWLVIYCYPMTGRPDMALPDGWDAIPGARGCTPQSCGFRDHHQELQACQAQVFGLSTQSTAYQQEAAGRLHLPFALLSDEGYKFSGALGLPSFTLLGQRLNKRVTLIIKDGIIRHVFYPVFPPDQNAADVITWLQINATS